MIDYVDEILSAFDMAESKKVSKAVRKDPKLGAGGTKSSAAPADLFKIDEDDCEKLVRSSSQARPWSSTT
jgi:hypothetical protein